MPPHRDKCHDEGAEYLGLKMVVHLLFSLRDKKFDYVICRLIRPN